MQKREKFMQNRSIDSLPALFVDALDADFNTCNDIQAEPLEILEFTYLHYHSQTEIGICVEGEGICYVEGKEYSFKSGDVQIVFPFQRHLSKSRGIDFSRWKWLTFDILSLLSSSGFTDIAGISSIIGNQIGICGIFTKEEHPEITRLVKEIFDELTRSSPFYRREICASFVHELLLRLVRASHYLPPITRIKHASTERILPAVRMISEGIDNGKMPTVEELAAACNMSASNFRKSFSSVVGLSPKDYMIKTRVIKAQRLLLERDASIYEAAELSGFSDISGFNRHFRAHAGCSPSEFRKRFKPGGE